MELNQLMMSWKSYWKKFGVLFGVCDLIIKKNILNTLFLTVLYE
jgi:hypothetical protein